MKEHPYLVIQSELEIENKKLKDELTRLKAENNEYELNLKINLQIMENQEQEIDRLKAKREKEIL